MHMSRTEQHELNLDKYINPVNFRSQSQEKVNIRHKWLVTQDCMYARNIKSRNILNNEEFKVEHPNL